MKNFYSGSLVTTANNNPKGTPITLPKMKHSTIEGIVLLPNAPI